MVPENFKSKFLPLAPLLYRLAFNMLGNEEDAKDAVQDVYCKIFKEWSKVGSSNNPEGYCVRMLQNTCRDSLERKGKALVLPDNGKAFERQGTIDSPEAAMLQKEETAMLRKALGQLPEKYRRVVVLRDLEQKEFGEIEMQTGMSPVNIRVILSRGRKMLKEIIAKNC